MIFSKNHTRRSAIKFCVDPIFVGSELIGNRTSYDQNTFYIKYDYDDDEDDDAYRILAYFVSSIFNAYVYYLRLT